MPVKPASAYDLIDKAVSNGVSLLQVADNIPLENLAIDELKKLISYAQEKKVSIEFGSRGLTPEHTIKCLETAEFLNSPILRMVIDRQGYEPDLMTIISIIKDLLPEFKSRNISLAIENHDRFKAREFEKIVRGGRK